MSLRVVSSAQGSRVFPLGFMLYLSGPMTGMPEHNFPAFNAYAEQLRTLGFGVMNPAELDADVGTGLPWEFYLKRDIKLLMDCHGIFMMEGWTTSRGAKLEFDIAVRLGYPVIYYDETRGRL